MLKSGVACRHRNKRRASARIRSEQTQDKSHASDIFGEANNFAAAHMNTHSPLSNVSTTYEEENSESSPGYMMAQDCEDNSGKLPTVDSWLGFSSVPMLRCGRYRVQSDLNRSFPMLLTDTYMNRKGVVQDRITSGTSKS